MGCITVTAAIQVCQAPVTANHQIVVLLILGTYTETDSRIPALETFLRKFVIVESGISFLLLHFPGISTVSIYATLMLTAYADGKVRTNLTIETQVLHHIIAETNTDRDLQIMKIIL